MWELDPKEGRVPKNWCFWTVVLEKSLESPLDSEMKPVNPKGNQPWIFIERTDAEVEASILWPSDVKSQLIGKDPDAGKDWGQEEKGAKEDEMVGWHHWLSGHEFKQTPGDTEGQTSLAFCCPWGRKELDTTEWPNNTNEGKCHVPLENSREEWLVLFTHEGWGTFHRTREDSILKRPERTQPALGHYKIRKGTYKGAGWQLHWGWCIGWYGLDGGGWKWVAARPQKALNRNLNLKWGIIEGFWLGEAKDPTNSLTKISKSIAESILTPDHKYTKQKDIENQ